MVSPQASSEPRELHHIKGQRQCRAATASQSFTPDRARSAYQLMAGACKPQCGLNGSLRVGQAEPWESGLLQVLYHAPGKDPCLRRECGTKTSFATLRVRRTHGRPCQCYSQCGISHVWSPSVCQPWNSTGYLCKSGWLLLPCREVTLCLPHPEADGSASHWCN